jgi:hypothetical protein
MKVDFHQLFNKQMLDFAKDLCEGFPDIGEFKRFRSGVLMLQNLEPKTLESIFRTYVIVKYKDKLLMKDESFFLNHDDFELLVERTDYCISLINQLKTMWATLDPSNKEIIWKYFHVMIVLSDKCHSS